MKRNALALLPPFLGGLMLCAASAFAGPATASLPGNSVYQLSLPLTDQHGKTGDWRSRRGHPQLVAMFYTSCPNMCPLIVDSGKTVEHALSTAERAELRILFISLDPARDTPAALMSLAHARKLDGTRWSLVAPRAEDVRSVAGLLGVRYRRLADGQFNHTSALLLLDRDGRIVGRTEQVGSVIDPEFIRTVHRVIAQR